jgi:hypothetical protein
MASPALPEAKTVLAHNLLSRGALPLITYLHAPINFSPMNPIISL